MNTNILTMIKQAEVVWKPLGEVAKIQRGASPRPISQYLTDDKEGIPWIKIGDVAVGAKYVEQTEQRITYEGSLKSRFLKKGDFIMSNSMSYGRPYILNIDGAIHDGWASISEFQDKINSDFLYYYLSSDIVQSYWTGKINSGSVSNLNSDIIKSLLIPIPPLELQKEIVKILDILTELNTDLTTALETEHILRKKQYHYYRDFLLSETELAKLGFEWKRLGEVTLPTQNIKWKNQDGLFKYIDLTSVDLQTHAITQTTDIGADTAPSRAQKLVATDDVIFATTRPTQMRLTIIPKEFNGQIASTGYCVLRADKSQILPK